MRRRAESQQLAATPIAELRYKYVSFRCKPVEKRFKLRLDKRSMRLNKWIEPKLQTPCSPSDTARESCCRMYGRYVRHSWWRNFHDQILGIKAKESPCRTVFTTWRAIIAIPVSDHGRFRNMSISPHFTYLITNISKRIRSYCFCTTIMFLFEPACWRVIENSFTGLLALTAERKEGRIEIQWREWQRRQSTSLIKTTL